MRTHLLLSLPEAGCGAGKPGYGERLVRCMRCMRVKRRQLSAAHRVMASWRCFPVVVPSGDRRSRGGLQRHVGRLFHRQPCLFFSLSFRFFMPFDQLREIAADEPAQRIIIQFQPPGDGFQLLAGGFEQVQGLGIFLHAAPRDAAAVRCAHHTLTGIQLSLIHISEPTRLRRISYAVFCLKKKK